MDASEYHRIAESEDAHWWYRSTRALVQHLLADVLRRDMVTLDVGAGPGGNGAWLGEYGTVVALDVEPIALEYVRSQRPGLVPLQGSAVALPIASATVDVVLALTVLYHIDDDGAAFREIARVLRPGGVALVLEPAFSMLHREHDELTHGVRRYRKADLRRLALDAGLTVFRTTYAKSFLFAPAAIIALVQRLIGRRDSSKPPRSDLEPRPFDAVADAIFNRMANVENWLLRRRDLPFGTSVLIVARRAMSSR